MKMNIIELALRGELQEITKIKDENQINFDRELLDLRIQKELNESRYEYELIGLKDEIKQLQNYIKELQEINKQAIRVLRGKGI